MPFLASNIDKEKYSCCWVTEIANKTKKIDICVTKLPFYQFSWAALIFMKKIFVDGLLHNYQNFCKI